MSRRLRIALIIFGVIVFGILMGIRHDMPSGWTRTVVSAISGGILGGTIVLAKDLKRNSS